MKKKFEEKQRKSIFSEIDDYCHLSKESDFIEVTEWSNGDGFDINIYSGGDKTIPITNGQWDLLKKMVKQLNN